MKLQKFFIFQTLLLFSVFGYSQQQNQLYLNYINQYYRIAQIQQKEYGIPSSITLAQGLLESGAGKSYLATTSNNHFGIKCSDWAGEKVYYDDDAKGECFRKYNQVVESYKDHSLFLSKRPRYASLFKLAQTDYEGWAFGLKSAGYATDPTYAFKLISIIENYGLNKYDRDVNTDSFDDQNLTNNKSVAELLNSHSMGNLKSVLNHPLYRVNKVKFVISEPGDSFASIADEFGITEERLRRYNEVFPTTVLLPNSRVFIEAKKAKAPKECLVHVVTEGESMYSISQDFGVKVIELYKLNRMDFADCASVGQRLILR